MLLFPLILALTLLVACGSVSDSDDGAAPDNVGGGGDTLRPSDSENGAAPDDAGGGGDTSRDCALVMSGVEDIHLETQEDVEALRGVRTVEASLFVTGGVTDLSPLACLSHVQGDLGVYETESLHDLTGLEQLQTIGGSLDLGGICNRPHTSSCHGNVALTDISALTNLQAVSSVLIRPVCDGEGGGCVPGTPIEELRFDALTEVDELAVATDAVVEVRLDALESAKTISLSGSRLQSLHFPQLTNVEGLNISGETQFKDLRSFSQISQMTWLMLWGTGLTDLTGLDVAHLAGLSLYQNDELVHLSGLESLQEAETVRIVGNQRLESLEGLNSVRTIDDIEITLNPALISLAGLEGLTYAGKIFVQSNYALTDIRALSSLEMVESSLMFWTNSLLPHCEVDRLRELIGEENVASYAVSGGDEEAECDP